jgi:hypothetical protein
MTNDTGHGRSTSGRPACPGGLQVKPDAAEERERLASSLAAIRQQRRADEAQGNELPQLLRAIARARRDRDSGMSYRLRAHRDHLEKVFTDAEDLIFSVIEVKLFIHIRGLEPGDPLVHEARKAVRRGQDAIHQLNQDLVGARA